MELEKAVTWGAIATIIASFASSWVSRMRDKDTTKIAQDAEINKKQAALDLRAEKLHEEHVKMLKEQIEAETKRADKEKARADKAEEDLKAEREKHVVKVDVLQAEPLVQVGTAAAYIELKD